VPFRHVFILSGASFSRLYVLIVRFGARRVCNVSFLWRSGWALFLCFHLTILFAIKSIGKWIKFHFHVEVLRIYVVSFIVLFDFAISLKII